MLFFTLGNSSRYLTTIATPKVKIMTKSATRITKAELSLFWFELSSKFWGGFRTINSLLYLFFTLMGVGIASWGIPVANGSEISPETLGIYVIGFLIAVGLDALYVLISPKAGSGNNSLERVIAGLFTMFAALLTIWAWYLSTTITLPESRAVTGSVHETVKQWRFAANYWLSLTLGIGILMSITIAGIDPNSPDFASTSRDLNAITDK